MYFAVFLGFTNISRNIRILQKTIQRNKSELISLQSRQKFEKSLAKHLSKLSTENFINPIFIDRVKKIAECTTYEKDMFRGSLAIFAYETMEKPANITEKSLHQIQTLAWGAEMTNSYFMILEDLEKSLEECFWCNYDPSLLRSFVYELLKSVFMDHPSYKNIVHLYDKAFLNTSTGHLLDEMVRKDYKNFTTETYNSISNLKTSFHMFQLPISLAANILGNVDARIYQQIQSISLQLGRLYNMQNDFLNCYGEETDQTGIPKLSYDIQRGRCSWLAVAALQRCTATQRIVFSACYGSKEPAHIERVKLLYDQIHLPRVYREEKEKMCEDIVKDAKKLMLQEKMVLKVLDVIKDRDIVSNK